MNSHAIAMVFATCQSV